MNYINPSRSDVTFKLYIYLPYEIFTKNVKKKAKISDLNVYLRSKKKIDQTFQNC